MCSQLKNILQLHIFFFGIYLHNKHQNSKPHPPQFTKKLTQQTSYIHPMGNYALLFRQSYIMMYTMFSEAFVPPPAPPSYPDIPTKIIACISIVTLLFLLLNHILNVFLAWVVEAIPELDHESGDIIYGPINVGSNNQFRQVIVRILHTLGVIKNVVQEMDEKRGPRLRDLKKLPPLVCYGSHGMSTSRSTTDCAICLEDFSEGESCQVFSMCNHVFHSNCIDHWLMNRPTCPVCRNCIIDI